MNPPASHSYLHDLPAQRSSGTLVRKTLACLVLLLAAGCSSVMLKNPKQPFAGYQPVDKINLKVALNITDDLLKPEWNQHFTIIRPGGYLAENCEILAQHVFREVIKGGSDGAGIDAVLTPKLVYVNRTQGATSFGESITTIKIEWNMTEPAGKTVWIETVAGEARGSTGWTNPEKLLKQALEELLAKSQQAISSSEVIRQFATLKAGPTRAAMNRPAKREPNTPDS